MKNSIILYVFALLLVISACECKSVCSCNVVGIEIEYQNQNGNCIEIGDLITVNAFANNNTLVSDGFVREGGFCSITIPYEEVSYWIIQSDSLAISDTLRIENVVFNADMSTECCNCGPSFNSITYTVNDTTYNSNNIMRFY